MILKNNIKLLSGDASFRKFYRKKNKKKSSIIVFSRKEKKKNLLIYDAINKILIKNKIRAPNLIRQNYNNNFIEIEDFGNLSIYEKLRKKKINKIILFKKIINLLVKIQKIKTRKVETFNNSKYRIPNYTKNKLLAETNLFLEWYIPKVIKKKNQNMLKKKLKLIFKKLLNKVKSKNNTFVHRDFHVSNLMEYKKDIAIIDSQDAVFGNLAYDLASLIDDVRFKTNFKEKNKIFSEYMKFHKNININKFKKDFEILSVLRNLKIIGIFTRLSIRDKKNNYLNLIPSAWKLIELRIKNNKNFLDLEKVLNNNFSKKIRMIK
tara:strand:- start:579 stop:1538 length:960 start_codon:yes stop_codon:yes gene_type:complete